MVLQYNYGSVWQLDNQSSLPFIILLFGFTLPVTVSWSSDLKAFWFSQKVLLITPAVTSKLLKVQPQNLMAQ